MTEKIVLFGAGSAMFTRGLVSDLLRSGIDAELALVDVSPDALEVAEKLAVKMIAAHGSRIPVTASVEPRAVLQGASAVICTVGVGGRRAWERDVFIPRQHGIYQPVGDTVGPGGTSRAFRMIPAMVKIAEDVLDLAPEALFFNYSNPMSPVCRGIRKATGAPVVGLCHGVPGVASYLARALEADVNDLDYTAVGINHLTWFMEIRHRRRDAMPRLIEMAEMGAEVDPARQVDPFSWHLLRIFGAFPAVLDRHVIEFFPQMLRERAYYGKTPGVDCFSFEGTIAGGDRIYAEMREDALSPKPLRKEYLDRIGGEHEQVIDIIGAIRANRRRVYSVNLPNTGQIPNLPPEAVVECPAVVDGGRLRPIAQRPLPVGVAGTLATRFMWVETIVEAALEGSRRKFIQALLLDGAVTSPDAATRLADDLLAAQADYLPAVGP